MITQEHVDAVQALIGEGVDLKLEAGGQVLVYINPFDGNGLRERMLVGVAFMPNPMGEDRLCWAGIMGCAFDSPCFAGTLEGIVDELTGAYFG
jgi:hypothetical protein